MAQGNGQLFNLADHAPIQRNIIGPELNPSPPQHYAPLQQHQGFFQGVIDEQPHHQQNQNQNILFPPLPPNPPPREVPMLDLTLRFKLNCINPNSTSDKYLLLYF